MSSELIPYKTLESMATDVVRGGLFPGIKTVPQALTLFLVAQAEGLHPMTAAMRYNVIQNRPALKADAMLASFMERGGTVKWIEWTNEVCEAEFKSVGCPDGVKVRWTMEDAKRAGVTGNPTWSKYPRQMLKARVASDGVRMADPAVNYGRYTPEEVEDFEPVKIEHEVVGDEAGNVVRGASHDTPAPPAILSGKDLTWDELANLYDKHNSGRKARTLPMDKVADWAESRRDLFHISQEGGLRCNQAPHVILGGSMGGKTIEGAAIQSATGQTTEEHLAEAKKKREEALEQFGPPEPIEKKLAKISADVAKKLGRPKSVPDFCTCGMSVSQFTASTGGTYWECQYRNRERAILKEQEVEEAVIRDTLKGHTFHWSGK